MNTLTKPERPTEDTPKKKWFVFGTFSLSIFLHLILLLMAGGIVIIQGVLPKQEFMAEPVSDVVSQEISPPEEPSPDMPEQATVESVPEQSASRSEEIITTEPISAQTFSMPAATITTLNANAALSLSPGQGTQSGPAKGGARIMTSLFGIRGENPDGLVGYFYDLKQSPEGKPTDMAEVPNEKVLDNTRQANRYREVVGDFVKTWNPAKLKGYYRAPEPLSTFQICMPLMNADAAPKAFEVGGKVKPRRWLIHYKGTVKAPTTGTFRFVGLGDDVLIVRFNNKNVIDAGWTIIDPAFNDKTEAGPFVNKCPKNLRNGEWFDVAQGSTYPIEILIGENPGGAFASFLMIQEKGKDYPQRALGGPILPVFQTTSTRLPPFQADVEGPAVATQPLIFEGSK